MSSPPPPPPPTIEKKKNQPKKCGLFELLIFIAAIISGTACSILSKTMMRLQGIGMTGETETFQKPIFQTIGMFIGMMFGLPMHYLCVKLQLPFPGYEIYNQNKNIAEENYKETIREEETEPLTNGDTSDVRQKQFANNMEYGSVTQSSTISQQSQTQSTTTTTTKIPIWMYFFLAIPSIFDLGATALCMMGLQYIDVSIYQLLRGSGIIFVALMKQYILKDQLYNFQWIGVFYNVVSVFLVGSTAILNERTNTGPNNEHSTLDGDDGIEESSAAARALLGVSLVMLGAIVQAMQFVFEEKVMTMDISAPPLLLIGMEGFWGTLLCAVFVYPLVYYLPGNDHGSYEDPFNTYAMFINSQNIQIAFIIYFFAIFGYNFFAVMVTFMLNSVWHAILDNFRPITVWLTDLFIFYVVSQSFGEAWTQWSYIQLFGMIVLLYGTSVYNAPNAGSVLLEGQWYSLGLNFHNEYQQIKQEAEEQHLDDEWKNRMQNFQDRKSSSFLGERSPHISIHTQSLRGFANSTA